LLLGSVGTIAVAVTAPIAGDVAGLVYGASFGQIGLAATLLLAATCVKASVSWSKVLPLAVGRPGWRLAYLSAEGALLLGLLLVAHWAAPGAVPTSTAYGWGALALSTLGTGCWLILMRRLPTADD
jgi:hypothetical protein